MSVRHFTTEQEKELFEDLKNLIQLINTPHHYMHRMLHWDGVVKLSQKLKEKFCIDDNK